MKIVTRLLLIWLAALAAPALAQNALDGDRPGSQDSPRLSRFPDSRIIDWSAVSGETHELVLGPMLRTAGRVIADESRRIQGDVTRITYDIPQTFTGAEAFNYFRRQLQERGAVERFVCEGRECGNSNYWANDVFGNRILYGPERNQYYLAAEYPAAQGSAVVTVYVITRTNRRVMAHLEIIEPAGEIHNATVEGLLNDLRRAGAVPVTGVDFDDSDQLVVEAGLMPWIAALNDDATLRVAVVAHLGGSIAPERLLERSRQRAQAVMAVLVDGGIDQSRLEAHGVGPLAPLCGQDNCRERVEIVLLGN